ncbi:VRR-NUC domain-containing protein [Konateibacter massiliensis]|uniref:VRR-NUC domain-containing protein n=1 Tax=Konateibacter massiliensis TaxID=2002841 RepID=UPI000C149DB7|nr:VRR-NUC domain-containing protein [Konateibacter massiliensis]
MRNFRLDDESGHQEALFSWAAYQMQRMPELEYLHHVPNGGKRDKATAIALKRQGVKAGVPDIHLPVARGKYHGLYIELKAGKNTTTANQKRWLKFLGQQGYYIAVCYCWQDAAKLLEEYLLSPESLESEEKHDKV